MVPDDALSMHGIKKTVFIPTILMVSGGVEMTSFFINRPGPFFNKPYPLIP